MAELYSPNLVEVDRPAARVPLRTEKHSPVVGSNALI